MLTKPVGKNISAAEKRKILVNTVCKIALDIIYAPPLQTKLFIRSWHNTNLQGRTYA
jgi:hypothetical protein